MDLGSRRVDLGGLFWDRANRWLVSNLEIKTFSGQIFERGVSRHAEQGGCSLSVSASCLFVLL